MIKQNKLYVNNEFDLNVSSGPCNFLYFPFKKKKGKKQKFFKLYRLYKVTCRIFSKQCPGGDDMQREHLLKVIFSITIIKKYKWI